MSVGPLEMEWCRVVNLSRDVRSGEMTLEEIAVLNPDHVEVIYRPGPLRFMRHRDRVHVLEELRVLTAVLATLSVPVRQVLELDPQNPGLDGVQSAVISLGLVMVLLHFAVIAKPAHAVGEAPIVGRHRTGLSTRAQVFARIEAERSQAAHGAGSLPTTLLGREVLGPVRLTRVFDHGHVVSAGDLEDR